MRIYVSGPYSAPAESARRANVYKAMDIGMGLLSRGHAPLVPHLSHYFDAYITDQWEYTIPWDDYMKWDLELLAGCEALYFIGHSPGADMELAEAERLGLPIFRNLGEVPRVNEV